MTPFERLVIQLAEQRLFSLICREDDSSRRDHADELRRLLAKARADVEEREAAEVSDAISALR